MSKKPQKRTFRKKADIYKPQTLGCPYCGGKAILRQSQFLFGDNIKKNTSSHYYVCNNYPKCNTYIPCCQGNFAPYGKLANAHLRQRRTIAHRYIDLIVDNEIMFQRNVYSAISSKLNLTMENSHIRYSTDYSIEKIIGVLREILDNHHIEYDPYFIEELYHKPKLVAIA